MLAARRGAPYAVRRSDLSSSELTFVEVLVLGGEPLDDPNREIEDTVLSKTGKTSAGSLRAAVLWAFFKQDLPFV